MLYSKKVMQHFIHPRNLGKIKNPDGVGNVGNPVCGDIMTVYIKVKKEKEKKIISDIKFETLGCVAAIAASSMLTEIAKGKTLDQAVKITRNDIADELEGLPPIKMHCSNLAADALREAIKDYERKRAKNKKIH